MTHQKRNLTFITLLLGALCVVTPFAIDMYLPAFSMIATAYKTSSSQVSLTLSTYFVGFGLGQVFYGPFLDRFGRKRPLYWGLAIYILASLGCAVSPDLKTFVGLRLLEALGGCVAQVAAIAMVRDFFPPKDSAKMFSMLFLMIGVSPLAAPTIGSAVMTGLGWQWIFVLLAAIALVILALIFFFLPEGHQPDRSVSLQPGAILRDYCNIFKVPQFVTYALAGAFSFAGLFTYVAGSPIIFMDGFHMGTKAFGIVFAVLVMGFIGGNQVNVVLLKLFSSQKIFVGALFAQAMIGLIFWLGMRSHLVGLPATLVLFFFFLSCIGLTNPNAAAVGLAPFSKDAGRASALLGFLQASTGALVSMGIGFLGASAVVTLLAVTAVAALLLLLVGRTQIRELIVNEEAETVVMH